MEEAIMKRQQVQEKFEKGMDEFSNIDEHERSV